MERNPYAPPVSHVADPTENRGERPKEVHQAIRLLWIGFVLGIVGIFLQPMKTNAPAQWIGILIGGAIAFGIWAWVIVKIANGRNWARILFIVLAIIGLVFSAFSLPFTLPIYKARPLSGVLAAVNLVLEVSTLYLLLTTAARTWFKPPQAATA
jgi:hypothetical protein